MHANEREEIKAVYAGDIAAAVGLKKTTTGDTLCDEEHQVILESMVFPDPVVSVSIEPKTREDEEKLSSALHKLSEEDPTFKVRFDKETGQTIIRGMGELHLEVLVERMFREFNVAANVGRPEVAYRETIRGSRGGGGQVRQADRRPRGLRARDHELRASSRGNGVRLREQGHRRPRAAGVRPRGGEGHPGGHGERRAGRLPHGGLPRIAAGRVLPRRGLQRNGLQGRGIDGIQVGLCKSQTDYP